MSETHLEPNIHSDTLLFEGYDLPIRKDRTHNGGGVMIYMSNILKYTRRDDLEDPRLETIWVEVTSKAQNILICCFYRSDFKFSQSLFVSELQNSIETALDYIPFVILTGDLNIDFINFTNI